MPSATTTDESSEYRRAPWLTLVSLALSLTASCEAPLDPNVCANNAAGWCGTGKWCQLAPDHKTARCAPASEPCSQGRWAGECEAAQAAGNLGGRGGSATSNDAGLSIGSTGGLGPATGGIAGSPAGGAGGSIIQLPDASPMGDTSPPSNLPGPDAEITPPTPDAPVDSSCASACTLNSTRCMGGLQTCVMMPTGCMSAGMPNSVFRSV